MRGLQVTVSTLTGKCDSTELKKFAEDLRYSDPVSNETLADAEAELSACVNQFQEAV